MERCAVNFNYNCMDNYCRLLTNSQFKSLSVATLSPYSTCSAVDTAHCKLLLWFLSNMNFRDVETV